MRLSRIFLIVPVLGIGLTVPAIAGAHEDDQWQGRLEERTYDRMRELAHDLDGEAQHAAEQAIDSAHHGDRGERRFLEDMTHFARQAAEFHRRLDRYGEAPWDIQSEIEHMASDARRVNRQIRAAHVFEHTWDDWNDVVDVLAQMQRLAGVGHGRDRDAERYGYRRGGRDYRRW